MLLSYATVIVADILAATNCIINSRFIVTLTLCY